MLKTKATKLLENDMSSMKKRQYANHKRNDRRSCLNSSRELSEGSSFDTGATLCFIAGLVLTHQTM